MLWVWSHFLGKRSVIAAVVCLCAICSDAIAVFLVDLYLLLLLSETCVSGGLVVVIVHLRAGRVANEGLQTSLTSYTYP